LHAPNASRETAMQRSIYLARLLGPVGIAIGLGMLLNAAVFRILAGQFLASYALIFLSGILTLTAGMALVLAHNVWVGDWRVFITILGWLAVIGGVFRTVWPQEVAAIGSTIIRHGEAFMVGGFVMLVAGGVLAYFGYAEFFESKPARRSRRKRS
jgi:hypothetical protein